MDVWQFQCQFCFQIPDKEIYECPNGYIICPWCEHLVCPKLECRLIIMGKDSKRRQDLEKALDKMMMDCLFADSGCKEKFHRKDLPEHTDFCKFQKTVSICKLLNIPNCDFSVTKGNVSEQMFFHMQLRHYARKLVNGCNGKVVKQTFAKFFEVENETYHVPIQVTSPKESAVLVVATIKGKFVSWICLDLRQADIIRTKPKVQVQIWSSETPGISWNLPAVPIMQAEEYFNYPLAKTYIPHLKKLRKKLIFTNSKDLSVKIKCTEIIVDDSEYWKVIGCGALIIVVIYLVLKLIRIIIDALINFVL